MSRRFWFALALSVASVVLLSQDSAAQPPSPQKPKIKLTPVSDPVPGYGGIGGSGVTVQIIIVVVTTPDSSQQEVKFTGQKYQDVMSRAQNYASDQKAKGNKVKLVSR
jgi:hypothetical protein